MKGHVYKISNADESIVYIGSSILTIKHRWSLHKTNYKAWLEGVRDTCCSIYHHFKEFGIETFRIELISEHEIESKGQLRQFEQLVLNQTANACNQLKAYQSREERLEGMKEKYRANREERKRASRENYYANKDRINAMQGQKIECGCGGRYRHRDRSTHFKTVIHTKWLSEQ